jgi:SAM-dependent methyltransferase
MANPGGFDRAASFYDDTRGFPPGDEEAIAALMTRAANLQPDHNFVEIGIGTGRLSLPMLPYVRAVYGIDSSLPMLWRLRGKHADKPVYVAQGDVRQIPFQSAAFDVAMTAHMFNVIAEWRQAASEIARILRPDGVLLNCWHRNFHKESWWRAWTSTLPPGRGDVGLPHAQQHQELIGLGWRPIGDEYVHVMPRQLSARRFLEQLAGRVWTSTWALSESQLMTSIAAVREAMQHEHDDLDQVVEFDTLYTIRAYHPPLPTQP